jgi:alkylhydroperoxidase family enzyme
MNWLDNLRALRGRLPFRLRVLRASARLLLAEYRYYRDFCDESRRSALRWAWVICKHRVTFWVGQASRLAPGSGQQLRANS